MSECFETKPNQQQQNQTKQQQIKSIYPNCYVLLSYLITKTSLSHLSNHHHHNII